MSYPCHRSQGGSAFLPPPPALQRHIMSVFFLFSTLLNERCIFFFVIRGEGDQIRSEHHNDSKTDYVLILCRRGLVATLGSCKQLRGSVNEKEHCAHANIMIWAISTLLSSVQRRVRFWLRKSSASVKGGKESTVCWAIFVSDEWRLACVWAYASVDMRNPHDGHAHPAISSKRGPTSQMTFMTSTAMELNFFYSLLAVSSVDAGNISASYNNLCVLSTSRYIYAMLSMALPRIDGWWDASFIRSALVEPGYIEHWTMLIERV